MKHSDEENGRRPRRSRIEFDRSRANSGFIELPRSFGIVAGRDVKRANPDFTLPTNGRPHDRESGVQSPQGWPLRDGTGDAF